MVKPSLPFFTVFKLNCFRITKWQILRWGILGNYRRKISIILYDKFNKFGLNAIYFMIIKNITTYFINIEKVK